MARRKKDLSYAFEKNGSLRIIKEINLQGMRNFDQLMIGKFEKWLTNQQLGSDDFKELKQALRLPVAVFPYRLNPRMSSQLAMVLIFGGKADPSGKGEDKERSPQFCNRESNYDLESINDYYKNKGGKQFLKSFIVPSRYKAKIRDDLRKMGMHEAALFPEIDHVGNYIRKEWSFPKR